jgi:hypothetical protein
MRARYLSQKRVDQAQISSRTRTSMARAGGHERPDSSRDEVEGTVVPPSPQLGSCVVSRPLSFLVCSPSLLSLACLSPPPCCCLLSSSCFLFLNGGLAGNKRPTATGNIPLPRHSSGRARWQEQQAKSVA